MRFREDRHLDVDGVRTPRFSKIEYALLIALASLADTVADRRTLVSHVWGDDHDGVIRVVDVRVGRIRFKLDGLPRPLHLIDTVHGRGYRFVGRVAGALPVAPTGVLIHGWTIPRATSSATTSKRGD